MFLDRLMTWGAHTCRFDETLNDAAKIMWDHDCGCVPVVDAENRALAVVTDRDAAMAAYTQGRCPSQIPVTKAASGVVVTIQPDESVERALELMRRYRIKRLVVVDGERHVLGMLAMADVLRNLHLARSGDHGFRPETVLRTLEAIAEASSGALAAE